MKKLILLAALIFLVGCENPMATEVTNVEDTINYNEVTRDTSFLDTLIVYFYTDDHELILQGIDIDSCLFSQLIEISFNSVGDTIYLECVQSYPPNGLITEIETSHGYHYNENGSIDYFWYVDPNYPDIQYNHY